MWKEERSGISKYRELRLNKPVYVLGHQKDIFFEAFGDGQVCRERTNEERGVKTKDGRVECNVIGLPTSGCCNQQLYVRVGSSVSAVLKVTTEPGVHHALGLTWQATEL